MADRRGDKRVIARLRVWCESEDLTVLSETTNLSQGGLFLRTSSTRPPGPFKVTIDDIDVVALVEPRWEQPGSELSPHGIGVRIVQFERGEAAYHGYVDKLSARSGEHRLNWPASGPGGGDDGSSEGA
jgi:hypothetical protein